MEEITIHKRVLHTNLGTTRLRGWPRNRWQDGVREGGKIVVGERWQEEVHNREEWKKLLRMARNRRILHMPMEWMNNRKKENNENNTAAGKLTNTPTHKQWHLCCACVQKEIRYERYNIHVWLLHLDCALNSVTHLLTYIWVTNQGQFHCLQYVLKGNHMTRLHNGIDWNRLNKNMRSVSSSNFVSRHVLYVWFNWHWWQHIIFRWRILMITAVVDGLHFSFGTEEQKIHFSKDNKCHGQDLTKYCS